MSSSCRNRLGASRLWLLLAVGLLAAAPLLAQTATSSGTISGRVTDKTGALIVGAQITLTNIQTGAVRTTPSNQSGLYSFALVRTGTYIISATKSGFAKSNSQPTPVQVGRAITLNFAMQPGSETQTVEVTSEVPLVNTQKTGVSGNISTTQVQNLPLNGNDYGSLAVLVPGVKPVQPYDPTKMRVATFSVDGGTGRNVNVSVDGVEDKDNSVGGPVMQLPLNAIQEFKVSPSRFSAANGRSEGAAINVVEKEGTNKFHGGAQYYFTDTSLNANNYFSKQAGEGTPQFDRQQYGVDIGGPVRKNQDFFFFAFFRDNEKTQIPITPQAFQDLTLAEVIGAKPVSVIPTPYHDNRYSTRVDHTINSANHLSFNFNWQSNYGLNDQDGNSTDATDNNFTKNNMILGGLTWATVINPTTVNSLTGGYSYWNNLIATNQVTPYSVSFPDGTSFGTNGNVPQNTTEKKWQIRDDFSMIRGNHSLKFGEDTVWDPFLGGFFEYNMVPSLSFGDDPSIIAAHGVSTVNPGFTYSDGFSTPGAITGMSLTAGDPFYIATGGTKSYGLYAEDDWQTTQRLTLNLGLRYELDLNTYGQNDLAKNRTYLALKQIGSPYGALPKTDKGDLAPILGFTYDLTGHGSQLIRGGFGMYYGQVFQNSPLFALQQTDPTMFGTVYSSGLTGPGGTCTAQPCAVPGSGGVSIANWQLGVNKNPVWTGGATTALGPGSGGQIVDPNFRNPVSEQWNLGYTWGINPNNALRVDYVHELGLHEMTYQTVNHIINSTTGERMYDNAFTAAGLPDLGGISDASSVGRSRYDSLDVEWQRRMTHNFSMDVSYTLARSLAWGGQAADFFTTDSTVNMWDPVNFGYSGTDQRHRVVFSGIFNLPWGINAAPILQWGSARPYSTSVGSDIYGLPDYSTPGAIVPNSDPTNYTWINTAPAADIAQVVAPSGNFELACQAAGTCHQVPINVLRGQPFFDLDARIGKRVGIGDWGSVNLFFQGFDMTNRANFGSNFDGNVTDATFMKPTGYLDGNGVTIPKSFRGEFGVELTF